MNVFSFQDQQGIPAFTRCFLAPKLYLFRIIWKPSLNCRSYGITSLRQSKDDETPFTHWNKINNPSRDGLRFQNRILHPEMGSSGSGATALRSLLQLWSGVEWSWAGDENGRSRSGVGATFFTLRNSSIFSFTRSVKNRKYFRHLWLIIVITGHFRFQICCVTCATTKSRTNS